MKQLRFKYTVVSSTFFVLTHLGKARRMIKNKNGKYTDIERFEYARLIMEHMRKRSRTTTNYYGIENLNIDGGYIMYSNHQGKYDALGILLKHEKTCSVLWEKNSANRFLAREVCALVNGKLDKEDYRDMINVLNECAEYVKNGNRMLIFPEGGYNGNKNNLQEFFSGCFMASIKSKTPIIPVTIYDSYKSMDINTFEKVTTEVHFLKPIMPSEYEGMTKKQLCDLVKEKIENKLKEIEASKIK